jgi:hypothetical protein
MRDDARADVPEGTVPGVRIAREQNRRMRRAAHRSDGFVSTIPTIFVGLRRDFLLWDGVIFSF